MEENLQIEGLDALGRSVMGYITSHFERGRVFYVEDLEGSGHSVEVLRVALSNLVDGTERVVRLARGVYCYPETDGNGHALLPGEERLAQLLAERWHVRIAPCGSQAAYLAGFTGFQLSPLTYVSDGSYQYFNLQNGRRIEFLRRKSNKVFYFRSEVMRNLSEGLRHLGEGSVGEGEMRVVAERLREVSREDFEHDLKLCPYWVRTFIRTASAG